MGGEFEISVFVPEAVVAELPAVIAPKDNDGVIGQALAFEGVEESAPPGRPV